ncbi:ABC transporter substrate-binding protein [Rhodomicrobium vannielii ATCC 17100]|uniref:ABC transporter substrate-binding protein n=1 Tax=Rhodomicrobium vannielii TaxID=1069 RepID=UPI001917BC93|nr:ABC transporter substrate-binding protein [Rhodomicrobium vannielii]MBJ7533054.1 ABC transporter substrate-binding protein [Rhodomicrobium vannielii ATCC 17100]
MNVRISTGLLGAFILASAFQPAWSAPRDDKGGVLRTLATRVGYVLGTAASCSNIAQSRVKAVADKFVDVVRTSAASEPESAAILASFKTSLAEGTKDLADKKTDCTAANRDLANLESASTPQANAAPVAVPFPPSVGVFAAQTVAVVRGVSDNEIRFGASLPFTGPNKDYGYQIRVGIETAFKKVNDEGGVHGRTLRLIAADDGYEPARTAETMKQLYDNEQVFGFIGNFGTATAAVAAPYALERKALFYAGYSGASVLRRDPPDRYVFNYRASYAEETETVVRYLVKVKRLKPDQIAVFMQQDGFGEAGYAGVTKAMRALRGGDGGSILKMTYPRNSLDVEPAINLLKAAKTPIKAVVMVATYRAAAKFIEKSREAVPGLIYTNISAVGPIALRDELMLLGPKFASGVIVTEVVPAVEGYSSLILEYKSALSKYFKGESPDYVSLEYYVAAQIMIEALRRAGPQLDSEKLVEAFENMRDFDLGLGSPVSFSRSDHQGSHKVWGTVLGETGKYEPFDME